MYRLDELAENEKKNMHIDSDCICFISPHV